MRNSPGFCVGETHFFQDFFIKKTQTAFFLLPGVFKEAAGCYTTRYIITRRTST